MFIKLATVFFILQFFLRREKIICGLFVGAEGGDLENEGFWLRIIIAANECSVEISKRRYRWEIFPSRVYARRVP